MSPRFSPPRSNSGSAYSRHRPNHRVEILWRSLLRMHFLAEGGAALHVTQGKLRCAATTGTKEMLSPNRSDASHLPSAGLSAAEERPRVRPRPLPGLSLFGQPSRINLSESHSPSSESTLGKTGPWYLQR